MAKTSSKKAVAKKAGSPCRNAQGYKKEKANVHHKTNSEVSKCGEVIDFEELTLAIETGVFASFQGIKISENEVSGDDEPTITVELLKNKRGQKMKQTKTVVVKKSEVRQLTSVDMINAMSTDVVEEAEDKGLIEYENETWACNKCDKLNGNDEGYCKNEVDGKLCLGTKKCEMKSWAGCFASMKVCLTDRI